MQVERSAPLKLDEVEELARKWMKTDVDSALSGERVSNTWVTCLQAGDNSWKRLLIPNVLEIVKTLQSVT